MALPDYFLQELKARTDITELVSSYVNLKRRGKNMVGLCPFHNEKTGSFNIYPENGSFYCFGCGVGGDSITFVMKIENLDYMEAVRFLAQRAGLQMPEENVDTSLSRLRTRVLEVNRETARFYHNCLISPEGKAGLEYFTRRGLTMKTIRHFGLGYAPEGRFALVDHLKKLKFTREELIQANVAVPGRGGGISDRFYGRVMFPIIDLRGNVVAFGGRVLTDAKPKYINTSDTPVYHKSSGLFAMNFAKNSGENRLILAEGYMDVIALHAAGFPNTIASLGTSLTQEQAKIISRYAQEAVICYDSDAAGQKAVQRAIPILREAGLRVKVVVVPGNKDPDEFIRANGENGHAKFKALLESSGSDMEYRLQNLRAQFDPETDEGKIKYLTEACNLLAALENDIEREVYAGRLAGEVGVEKSSILAQVRKIAAGNARRREQKQFRSQMQSMAGAGDPVNPERARNPRVANAEEGILAYLFHNPDGIEFVRQRLSPEKFCTAFNRRVYRFILGKNNTGAPLSLTDFSADFSPEEVSALSRILAGRDDARETREDAAECIAIINSESGFRETSQILEADEKDLQDYLKDLRNKKK